jgi:membrane-associated phospholipid phosphatase
VKEIIKNNAAFLVPYLLFLIAGALLIATHTKESLHLFFNSHYNPLADTVFTRLTNLGDGITVMILSIALLFVRYKYSILLIVSSSIAGIITQFLKRTLFDDVVRPQKFFESLSSRLRLVPEIEIHLNNSFPSGHGTTAFATCLTLALIAKNKYVKFLMFGIALSIGYSRIYLSQHFFNDVYAGSLIGVGITLVTYYFMHKSTWYNTALANKGI